MRLLVRLLIIAGLVIGVLLVFLQNQQPLSLTLFGFYGTPNLSLGLWMLLFTLAGLITSLFWQLLIYVRPRGGEKVISQSKVRETEPRLSNSPDLSWENENPEKDWYPKNNTEEPQETVKDVDTSDRPIDSKPPQNESKRDTTYSYSYLKPNPAQKRNSTDEIYDAQYRVITPPYQNDSPSSEDDDEEEWV